MVRSLLRKDCIPMTDLVPTRALPFALLPFSVCRFHSSAEYSCAGTKQQGQWRILAVKERNRVSRVGGYFASHKRYLPWSVLSNTGCSRVSPG